MTERFNSLYIELDQVSLWLVEIVDVMDAGSLSRRQMCRCRLFLSLSPVPPHVVRSVKPANQPVIAALSGTGVREVPVTVQPISDRAAAGVVASPQRIVSALGGVVHLVCVAKEVVENEATATVITAGQIITAACSSIPHKARVTV